jgi:hypothetical protein
MFELRWIAAGVITGLLISTVMVPPTRKMVSVPVPHDNSTYHTPTGCVRLNTMEVPCGAEPDSFNLLASLAKK